jgi:hypothetical protein
MKQIEIKTIIKEIKSVRISIMVFTEEKCVRASANYDGLNQVDNVTIEGAEYDAWGTDDNYIYDLILSKLGLEKA